MTKTTKRKWLPRFSLRAFLLFCLLIAGAVSWVSLNYREYLAEQKLIEAFAKQMQPGSYLTVDTNGNKQHVGGERFAPM